MFSLLKSIDNFYKFASLRCGFNKYAATEAAVEDLVSELKSEYFYNILDDADTGIFPKYEKLISELDSLIGKFKLLKEKKETGEAKLKEIREKGDPLKPNLEYVAQKATFDREFEQLSKLNSAKFRQTVQLIKGDLAEEFFTSLNQFLSDIKSDNPQIAKAIEEELEFDESFSVQKLESVISRMRDNVISKSKEASELLGIDINLEELSSSTDAASLEANFDNLQNKENVVRQQFEAGEFKKKELSSEEKKQIHRDRSIALYTKKREEEDKKLKELDRKIEAAKSENDEISLAQYEKEKIELLKNISGRKARQDIFQSKQRASRSALLEQRATNISAAILAYQQAVDAKKDILKEAQRLRFKQNPELLKQMVPELEEEYKVLEFISKLSETDRMKPENEQLLKSAISKIQVHLKYKKTTKVKAAIELENEYNRILGPYKKYSENLKQIAGLSEATKKTVSKLDYSNPEQRKMLLTAIPILIEEANSLASLAMREKALQSLGEIHLPRVAGLLKELQSILAQSLSEEI